MFILNKKSILLFLSMCTFCVNICYAQYATIKAKTIAPPEDQAKQSAIDLLKYDVDDVFSEEEYYNPKYDLEKKANNLFKKFKKKKQAEENVEEEMPFEDEEGAVQNTQISPKKYENITVSEKNKYQINADKITYNEQDGNLYANGNVEIISKENKTTILADTAILEKDTQTLKLYDNVKILKGGSEMTGEYLLIDFNEENILMENPTYQAFAFEIKAQEGFLLSNNIELINGVAKVMPNEEFSLETKGFQRYEHAALDRGRIRNIQRYSDGTGNKQTYLIKTKNIILTSYKDHNSILLKDSDIYYNNHKIVRKTTIEFISDKQKEVKEMSAPQAGSLRGFGTYVAYGFVSKLPKGQTLKIMPAVVYGENELGLGLIGRYQSKRALLDMGYASSTTNLVARGKYKFGSGTELRYGRHAYMPEGFLGARRSGYAMQLQKTRSYYNEDLQISFQHGLYAGVMSDYRKHDQEEAYSTTRFRYMANIRKNILAIENKEQDTALTLNLMAQGAATVYGSGETTGIARLGPYITTRFKKWESSIGYLLSGTHGDSPFWFDKYRYGKSTIMINEKFNLNDKFAFGYRATITPMKDNPEEKLLTESRLYAMMGPQDLKFVFSYDVVRAIAHLDLMFIVGSDNSRIEFDKFSTRNLDDGVNKRDFYRNIKPIKINESETL